MMKAIPITSPTSAHLRNIGTRTTNHYLARHQVQMIRIPSRFDGRILPNLQLQLNELSVLANAQELALHASRGWPHHFKPNSAERALHRICNIRPGSRPSMDGSARMSPVAIFVEALITPSFSKQPRCLCEIAPADRRAGRCSTRNGRAIVDGYCLCRERRL